MLIEIYGRDGCGYCKNAVKFCEQHGYDFVYYNYSDDLTKREEMLRRNPEAKTVPQIFVGDEHVGGYDELRAKYAPLVNLNTKDLPRL